MARDKEHQSDVKAERHLVGRGHYSHPNMSRTKAKKKKKKHQERTSAASSQLKSSRIKHTDDSTFSEERLQNLK